MVEFLAEYGLFLAKTVTIVIAIIIIMATAVANTMKQRVEEKGSIIITHLNKEINDLKDEIVKAVEDEHTLKKVHKEEKKKAKREKKAKNKSLGKEGDSKKRIFVLNFDGDPKASQVDDLRKVITAVLTMAKPKKDEVMLRLESPGGMVHAYGLAASQLQRIRRREIPLTICVDKVAASGGYMMACVANKLIAAPFAYIGSIGVLVQIPNFNRLLKEKHVDYEMVTAGEYKRTLTMFGENTKKDREKMEEDIQEVHTLFKDFVRTSRPDMDIDKLATGETWLGSRARELGLVDETGTSDEYIVAACDNAEVYEVAYEKKKKITDKLGSVLEGALDNILMRWLQRSGNKDELIS
jgi:serine protease SohB